MAPRIRPFTPADIPFAVQQTEREGWSVHEGWFRTYLAHDPGGCLIAEEDGERVGLATTTRYAESAWIGNLIVVPEHRGRGLGTALLRRALEELRQTGVRTFRLDGDPPGMGIYRRIGFVDEYESLRFRLQAGTPQSGSPAQTLTPDRLQEVAAFDRPRFGDDRSRLLELLHGWKEGAFVVERKGAVAGYLLALPTSRGLHLGPCVADDREAAAQLLTAALGLRRARTVTLGIPAPNHEGRRLMEEMGFEATPSSYRMVLGERRAGGRPQSIIATAGGAVG